MQVPPCGCLVDPNTGKIELLWNYPAIATDIDIQPWAIHDPIAGTVTTNVSPGAYAVDLTSIRDDEALLMLVHRDLGKIVVSRQGNIPHFQEPDGLGGLKDHPLEERLAQRRTRSLPSPP